MATVQFHRFQLALGEAECWVCHRTARVAALVAPVGSIATGEEFGEIETGQTYEPTLLDNVAGLSDELESAVRSACPTFRPDVSKTMETTYWMNHCEHCDAKMGDFFLHNEPDGPFFAWPQGDYETQKMVAVGPGEVECGMPDITPPEPPRRKKKTQE